MNAFSCQLTYQDLPVFVILLGRLDVMRDAADIVAELVSRECLDVRETPF